MYLFFKGLKFDFRDLFNILTTHSCPISFSFLKLPSLPLSHKFLHLGGITFVPMTINSETTPQANIAQHGPLLLLLGIQVATLVIEVVVVILLFY